ncbi:SRPBCC family protein [Natronobacterium gregoryi]|uniref:Polyketide cyclase n=2 Tax=Natronobacterium gregoryi TaxID=44930 RepID=L0ADY6_NATGS|nr:SRPBCC family protein [Natronobacterium gregoryi]AFZ72061.1 Polyketide cyclase / dehydrase and lipid transport [Natronobacterium gregoryi SP2]ELY62766.1 hypothetical protein C490_17162 [Natronobacterium gregoryi SP2]PLK20035.1 polyketide cyclase [Natronobacterium gregoryi SP2]SFJ44747.1 Polyketide cyclase / dehydrase and lipid transport [Natronobacterium gregoryi]
MDKILLSTVAYRPPEEVFPYVRSFTEYPRYTDHLKAVDVHGDGGVGSIYDLRLAWWKLGYTARSKVVDVSPPTSLEWQLVKDVDARGEWRIEPEPDAVSDGGVVDDEIESASRIYFEAVYDPYSADTTAISLPRFVSLDRVVDKVEPRLVSEAESVVQRLVMDIEGRTEPRDVELTIHELP